jgi:hypothetical protein
MKTGSITNTIQEGNEFGRNEYMNVETRNPSNLIK